MISERIFAWLDSEPVAFWIVLGSCILLMAAAIISALSATSAFP